MFLSEMNSTRRARMLKKKKIKNKNKRGFLDSAT